MMLNIDPAVLEQVLVDYVGQSAAESIIVSLDEAVAEEAKVGTDTTATCERPVVPAVVESLVDGDVFSLDQGKTWHTFAIGGFGTVSVYASARRGDEAPTIRVPAGEGQNCLVQFAWTRLYHFDGEYYARIDCPDCHGEGLVKVEPTEPCGRDTDTCRCVRGARAVPERLFHVLVREASQQWTDVRARALNEASINGEGSAQIGDGYNEKFTGRRAAEIHLGCESPSSSIAEPAP